jgi:hypothetical protein
MELYREEGQYSPLVVSSPPSTEETGAMVREIESRQGKGRNVAFLKDSICNMYIFHIVNVRGLEPTTCDFLRL